VGGIDVVADGGADAGELAGGHGGADAGAADQHAALGLAFLDPLPELTRLVRIVDPLGRAVGAEVDHLVAERAELLQHALSQLYTAVVERDGDLHQGVTLPL
jgi:hypothetical protein